MVINSLKLFVNGIKAFFVSESVRAAAAKVNTDR